MSNETNTGAALPLPQGYQYFWYDEIDSTNAEALRKISQGLSTDSWFCADRQTAGRGMHGNSWTSQCGNLYASLFARLTCPAEHRSQISILAGLAAISAIEQFGGDDLPIGALGLKWPNDILFNGKKVCGILVESRTGNLEVADQFDVVIGFGINLAVHPEIDGLFPAGNLAQSGWSCTRNELLVALVKSMRDWLAIWRYGEGFETLRIAWLERSCHLGQILTLKTGDQEFTGRFTTLAANGAIILEDTDGGLETFVSGHTVRLEPPVGRS